MGAISEALNRLIQALGEKPLTWDEIREVIGGEGEIFEEVVGCLNVLMRVGMVRMYKGFYCWKGHWRIIYKSKLNHSRMLIPALRKIAGIEAYEAYSRYRRLVEHVDEKGVPYLAPPTEKHLSEEKMKILVKWAENHLRAYPEIWSLLKALRELEEKDEKMRALEMRQTLQEEVRVLIYRIEIGEILAGHCEGCPRVLKYFRREISYELA